MQSFYDLRRICTVSKTRENDSVTGWSSVERAGRVHGLLPRFSSMVHFQVCFMRSSGHGWLGMLVALAGVKSVPIGTVFRSKRQKCTKLVRFSGFLVLLSRFVVVVQGIIPARGWIEEGDWAGFWAAAGNEAESPTQEPDLPRNIVTNVLQILAKPTGFTHSSIHHPDLHILPW